jgi:hypothetical protein
MKTFETEFGMDEKVIIKPKRDEKYGIVREIVLSSNGAKPHQEYGVEVITPGIYHFEHFKRSQLQTIS